MAVITNEEAAARLKPILSEYTQVMQDRKYKEAVKFFHKNAVVVETDKKALYGAKAIIKSFEEADAATGKSTFTLENPKYEGVGDFINLYADFTLDTEKAGVLKGRFLQIWRKDGAGYTIYHDEYTML